MAQLVKNVVVAGVCGAIFFGQGKEEAFPTFSNSSFNVSSLWYFAMLYTVLSCLQIIPQLFFYKVRYDGSTLSLCQLTEPVCLCASPKPHPPTHSPI